MSILRRNHVAVLSPTSRSKACFILQKARPKEGSNESLVSCTSCERRAISSELRSSNIPNRLQLLLIAQVYLQNLRCQRRFAGASRTGTWCTEPAQTRRCVREGSALKEPRKEGATQH